MSILPHSWSDSSNTNDHTDPSAIDFVPFTGAESLHVDNETIELSSSDRHLQVKNLGIGTNQIADNAITSAKLDVDTDDISEGSSNLYYTEGRFHNKFWW